MKRILIIVFISIIAKLALSQELKFLIDTVQCEKDSIVVFVKEFQDSVLIKTYYGILSEPEINKFRYGFLWLKRGESMIYTIEKAWGIKEYVDEEKSIGYRGPEHEKLVIIERKK